MSANFQTIADKIADSKKAMALSKTAFVRMSAIFSKEKNKTKDV